MSKHVQCLSIVLVYVVFAHPNPAWSSDYDWYVYNMNKYALTQDYGNWEECEAEAVSAGGHLANINDADENAWLTQFIKDALCRDYEPNDAWAYNLAWIGFECDPNNPIDDPNFWFWVCGDAVTYMNLLDVFPQLGHHAYLDGANHLQPGKWNAHIHHDRDTWANPRGIIEIKSPYVWEIYDGHRYALTLNYGSWEECEAEAVALGGHLANINDDLENFWLTEFIRGSLCRSYTGPNEAWAYNLAWIGFECDPNNPIDDPNFWFWVCGDPVTYMNLCSVFPQLGHYGYLHGVDHLQAGTWNAHYWHNDYSGANPRGIIELDGVYQLALHVTHEEWGDVTVEPNLPVYEPNTTVTLIAKPDEGKYWGGWQGDVPAGQEFDNPLVITMDSDKNIATAFKCGFGMGPMLPLTAMGLLGVFLIRRWGS